MTKSSQLLDDVMQLAGGVAGIAGGMKEQVENDIKARVDEMASRLDLVPREDLERVENMLAAMEERVSQLEAKIKDNQ